MSELRHVLRTPVVTEKATNLRDKGTYTFRVDRRANKVQIRKAVESIFDVRIRRISTNLTPEWPGLLGSARVRHSPGAMLYFSRAEGVSITNCCSAAPRDWANGFVT